MYPISNAFYIHIFLLFLARLYRLLASLYFPDVLLAGWRWHGVYICMICGRCCIGWWVFTLLFFFASTWYMPLTCIIKQYIVPVWKWLWMLHKLFQCESQNHTAYIYLSWETLIWSCSTHHGRTGLYIIHMTVAKRTANISTYWGANSLQNITFLSNMNSSLYCWFSALAGAQKSFTKHAIVPFLW
jgi:hypothetical protein